MNFPPQKALKPNFDASYDPVTLQIGLKGIIRDRWIRQIVSYAEGSEGVNSFQAEVHALLTGWSLHHHVIERP